MAIQRDSGRDKKPESDDEAVDEVVRVLAQHEVHIRRRWPTTDHQDCADVFSDAGMKGAMPKRGLQWEDICEKLRSRWAEISVDAVEQALNEAIYDFAYVNTEDGSDFRQWIDLSHLQRDRNLVFRLTEDGLDRAAEIDALPAHLVKARGKTQPTNADESNIPDPSTSKTGDWLKLIEGERITGINRGTIARAANRGDIKDNGRSGFLRRIGTQSFVDWTLRRAENGETEESPDAVRRKLRAAGL
ncbi:MAG: hypothetical protein ABII12_02175 [Planctomycetota bacterium]